MFKCALLYGMSSQEFWFGNPQDFFVYQDAFADKEKQRYKDADIMAWRFGYYNMLAFAQVYSNAFGKKGQNKKIFPPEPCVVKEEKQKQSATPKPLLAKFLVIESKINATLARRTTVGMNLAD